MKINNTIKKSILALGVALTIALAGQNEALARQMQTNRVTVEQVEKSLTEVTQERETNRYHILEVEDGMISGEAINNITDDNWGIWMWTETEEKDFPIVANIKPGDFIEVEFGGEDNSQIESISVVQNVIEYRVSQIEYYNEDQTEGYIFLEPCTEDNKLGMGIHIDINKDTLEHIKHQLGDYMSRHEIEAIDEGDIIILTIDTSGISKLLAMY